MAEQPADALDDGQAQAGATIVGHAVIQTPEFFEDLFLQGLGNAGPLVVHLDAQPAAATTAADQHRPRGV